MLWMLAAVAVALVWTVASVGQALLAIWIDEQADINRKDRIRKRRAGEGLAWRDMPYHTDAAEKSETPTGLPIGAVSGPS